jgi:hypothetical protein
VAPLLTGRIGQLTIAALERVGHQTVPVSRAAGVDAYASSGLDPALRGVDVVIDSTNTSASDPRTSRTRGTRSWKSTTSTTS